MVDVTAVVGQQVASARSSPPSVFLSPAAKKAKKVQRPLKKQMSSPNFQRRDKAEKVSQQLYIWRFKLRNFIVRMSETHEEKLFVSPPQAQSRDNTPFM